MKDRFALIVIALIVSALSWAFWHYLGADAFNVFTLVLLVVLTGENYQLRKKLRTRAPNGSK